jgi:DMSO/TMAO reductase YedYZ heme-binding membrane subunit
LTSMLPWYVARAGGIVAWALATASVLWGLAFTSRALGRRPRPAWLFDLHRFLGGLALAFTAVHVLAVVADSYVRFTLVNVLVPFTGHWHPVAVAWGVIALYLMLAVELTALARSRLPRALWRRVHYASFAVFGLATIHALAAGTDTTGAPFRLAVIGSLALILPLAAARGSRPSSKPATTATPARSSRTVSPASQRTRPASPWAPPTSPASPWAPPPRQAEPASPWRPPVSPWAPPSRPTAPAGSPSRPTAPAGSKRR